VAEVALLRGDLPADRREGQVGASPLDVVVGVFSRWLLLPDTDPVYAMLGAAAANYLPGQPVCEHAALDEFEQVDLDYATDRELQDLIGALAKLAHEQADDGVLDRIRRITGRIRRRRKPWKRPGRWNPEAAEANAANFRPTSPRA
jgi:hypothetical protein